MTTPPPGPADAPRPPGPAATASPRAHRTPPGAAAVPVAPESPTHAAPGPSSSPAVPAPQAITATGSSWPYLLMALFLVVVDQVTKYLIIDHFDYAERLTVIPGFFDLTLLYNPGAAFSFLADHGGWQRWFFTLIAVAVSGLLVYMLVRHRGSTMFNTAIGLVLGGAIGNLIDRLVLGHVTDFLLFYQGDWAFPAFNVADCAITVGAVLWILDEILQTVRARRTS